MMIQTTRFGPLEIDERRKLVFPKGILGFPGYHDYVLLEADTNPRPHSAAHTSGGGPVFWWLQSMDAPDVAFIVTDPSWFVPTYQVPLNDAQMAELGMTSRDDAQVLVIVNKRGHVVTGNLQGPLVVHLQTRVAEQLVLSDRRFTTRVPLAELPVEEPVVAMAG